MRAFSAVALFATIAISVSLMFIDDKWVSTISETSTCLLAATWMLFFAVKGGRPRSSPVLWTLGLVIAWGAMQIGARWTVYQWTTWLSLLYWLSNFSVAFAGVQSFSEARIRERFLLWLILFGFVVAVVSSLQALTTNSKIYWTFPTRFTGWILMGPFVYHNQYAAFIELLLPIALFMGLINRSWRWFYLVVSATMYASIFIAGSRAGFVLTTLELLTVPLVLLRGSRIPWAGLAGAGGIMAVMVVLLGVAAGPEYLAERFQSKDPYAIRREFVLSSAKMFRDRPLTGVGLGNWAVAYPAYASFDDGLYANQAHNDWAQWAVEGGAPMLALMVGLSVWVIPRAVRTGWGCGAAAVFLHCFVDYPIQRPAVAVAMFAIVAAICGAQVRPPKAAEKRDRFAARGAVPNAAQRDAPL